MRWMQALVFCSGLIYAAVDDLKTRTVSDIVCIIIALAGLVTISPASFLGALLAMLPFYLCAGLGLMGGGDWRLVSSTGKGKYIPAQVTTIYYGLRGFLYLVRSRRKI